MPRYIFFIVLALFLCHPILAQRSPCDLATYNDFIAKGQSLVRSGDYIHAFEYYNSAKDYCPEKGKIVDSLVQSIIIQIDKDKRRAYANDLAYKSQTALRDGLRTEAYRLAEFAHRYVDDDNLRVTRALVEALYYNDNPAHPPLPWASNLEGHTSGVNSVAFSPDGKRLATGSEDNTAIIWDLESGKADLTLKGHSNSVYSVAFSPDGKRLATGSEDKTAKIWDLDSGKTALTLEGHTKSVLSVAFSPDGKRLATGSFDKTAKIWDLESGKTALTLEGHSGKVWSGEVWSVAFSPDGKRLATGSGGLFKEDNTAKIWDLESGKTALTLEGHTNSVLSVSFSSDGKRLATGSSDNTAKIWDLESGKTALTLEGHTESVRSVSFSPDGTRLATGSRDNTAKIWDLESGKTALTLEVHRGDVNSVAFSPDGKRLATGSDDNTTKIWDMESGKTALTLEGHRGGVRSVAFSPDGKRLATGSSDNTAKIWDLESGKTALTLEGHTKSVRSVAFSPDGKRLVTGSSDNTAKIWDIESGKAVLTLEGHTDGVSSVAFSPDGKRLATGSGDNTAKIWDMDIPLEEEQVGKTALTLEGHTSYVLSVSFSPDGTRLATGSDETAKIWNLESGKTALTLEGHTKSVYSIAFSPDGKRLATGSEDETVKIWDLESGKTALTLEDHTESVYSIAFSPDGKRLATGSGGNTVKIWDLESGKTALTLEGHIYSVNSVAFSPDGKRLATGSGDNTVKIWDLTPRRSLGVDGRVKRLAGLTSPQLSEYGLENLLDQRLGNEDSLVAGKNVWQIAAFAELNEQQTRNRKQLQHTVPLYLRAARLYRAAANLSDDSTFVWRLGNLYKNWAEDILESGKPDTAKIYIDLACRLGADKSACPNLWQRFSEKTGQPFDFHQFLSSENPEELKGYGDYFFRKEKWEEARQLYEKAESMQHHAKVLRNLHTISEKTGQPFDFHQFLSSEDPEELKSYGDYFFRKEKWDEARRLYEKSESKRHDAEVLQNLYSISEMTGQPFDFNRFLASDDPAELAGYVEYFFEKERDKLKDYVPDLLLAVRLSEKRMTMDAGAAARADLVNHLINLAYCQLFLPDGAAAEATLLRAAALDAENDFIAALQPFALLLQGRKAETLFRDIKDQPLQGDRWKTAGKMCRWVLDNLEKEGVPGIDFALVREWLE